MNSSPAQLRTRSIATLASLGFEVPETLPLLEPGLVLRRTVQEVRERMLALNVAIAVSYGLPRKTAKAWLQEQGLEHALTANERAVVARADRDAQTHLRFKVETLWAFAWAVRLAPEMDPLGRCSDDLADLFPLPHKGEPASKLQVKELRDTSELLPACDLLYCLHWYVREHGLMLQPLRPGGMEGLGARNRRHAIEWLLCDDEWDEVSLDT